MELSPGIREIPKSGRQYDFKQEGVFGRVSELLIDCACDELAEMDLADYGYRASFFIWGIHSRDFP